MADVPAVANTAVTNDGAEDASMAETNAQFVLQIPPKTANLRQPRIYIFRFSKKLQGTGK